MFRESCSKCWWILPPEVAVMLPEKSTPTRLGYLLTHGEKPVQNFDKHWFGL
jgi:hypothetical protein